MYPSFPNVDFDVMYPLQKYVAEMYMAVYRRQRNKIDCSVFSAELRYEDLIEFYNEGDKLIENKYMIMRSEYNMKECIHKLTLQEINFSKKYSEADREPDDYFDFYEKYLTTN